MNWKTIRLELAGNREFPTGSVSRGFLIRVPLNEDGSIDEAALERSPQRATVRRFWSTEPDENGRLVRVDGHWALRCNGTADRLLSNGGPPFVPGEELEVVGCDGQPLAFKVASVRCNS